VYKEFGIDYNRDKGYAEEIEAEAEQLALAREAKAA